MMNNGDSIQNTCFIYTCKDLAGVFMYFLFVIVISKIVNIDTYVCVL